MNNKKPYFEPVDLKVDFSKAETELLKKWYDEGIVDKYLRKNSKSDKIFSFLDGPITANNPMGVHHAWGRTYKDIFQRYKNMQGYRQRFQNGFDCQGLWVEVEVEKELGLKSKKDIENLVPGNVKKSIAKFVELCKARATKFADIQTTQSKRLGYFMDWNHSYYTLSDENNYMIWNFLKKCHEAGLIYKGRDSVPWCPRCGTAISQHEMLTEDYRQIKHESVYLSYPLKSKKDTYLLVWTTTPWTLPGNVAIAADRKLTYVEATKNGSDKKYILLDSAAKRLNLKIERSFKGEELIGLGYEGIFDNLPRVKKSLKGYFHKVVATDPLILPVSEEEGTGLVHTAPGQGSEDFRLAKLYALPVIELIDEEAVYLDDLGSFSAKNAKKHPELILDYLKENDRFLFDIVAITHRYPACWRCKTELVWRVVDEWYIAMDSPSNSKLKTQNLKEKLSLRQRMIAVAKKIKWIPEFGLERELDWLSNMHDWLISKKRYWGLALPIWECNKCKNFEVIGSFNELKEKAVEGWENFEGNSPHKPWIDEIKIKCPKCGNIIERIPDVGNPWLDAGIVPFSTITQDNFGEPLYINNRKEWAKWFPANFITESFPGQFKNWFYSMIAMSTVLEGQNPYDVVLGFATLLGEDGRPMHKSWGNAIEFNEGAEKIGVDVMRWMFVKQNPADNLLFGYKIAEETRRKFHLTLWNIYNFFVTYANLEEWYPRQAQGISIKNILDGWIVIRLRDTIVNTTKALNSYDARTASVFIEDFVNDMSLWYIRRSRQRIGLSVPDSSDKNDFYAFTHFVLINLCKILAPFIPFTADSIFVNLTKTKSVHLVEWPSNKFIKNLDSLIGDTKSARLLIAQMDLVRKITEKGHAQRKEEKIVVKQPLSSITISCKEKCDPRLETLIKDELNVKNVIWKRQEGEELAVSLDTKITPELQEEAKTRQLIRDVQNKRKNLNVELSDKIDVVSPWIPKDRKLEDLLIKKALIKKISLGKTFEVKKSSSG